ncbi:hypothetical protein GCM10022221_12620 [Actinocorallia aurea]
MLNTFNQWIAKAFVTMLALAVLGFGLLWPVTVLMLGSSAAILGEYPGLGLWSLFLVTVPGVAGVAVFRLLLGFPIRSPWLLPPLVFPALWLALPVAFAWA